MGGSGARRVAVVIPARLGSRRFARKVLARETGKYLVQHVWERVTRCAGIDRIIIATDSDEVFSAVSSFGAEARMTSDTHVSGTDRVAEVARTLDHEIVLNVQGDEPLLEAVDLETLIGLFDGRPLDGPRAEAAGTGVVMTTLAAERTDAEGFRDPNVVKVVMGEGGRALYFSRAPVPWWEPRGPAEPPGSSVSGSAAAAAQVPWLQHIGIYAYRRDFLLRLSSLPPTPLERRERLEQLRVLENGFPIRVGITRSRHLGIDTEEEYRQFVAECAERAEHAPPSARGS